MWQACTTAAGVRIFGTSVSGFDFSLNYANIPVKRRSATYQHLASVRAVDRTVYGDADVAQKLGARSSTAGRLKKDYVRCLNKRGSQGNARNDPSQSTGITTRPRLWWARISMATIIRARFGSNNKSGRLGR